MLKNDMHTPLSWDFTSSDAVCPGLLSYRSEPVLGSFDILFQVSCKSFQVLNIMRGGQTLVSGEIRSF
jgi:hypothetical protein